MWTGSRRAFLAGCAGLALGTGLSAARAETAGLGMLAAQSGRFFGASLTSFDLQGDDAYLRLLKDQCSVWVPEWQLKWGALVDDKTERPDYAPVDAIVAAAKRFDKRVRGHALIWHEHLPDFVAELTSPEDWDRYVAPHILSVAGHYRNDIFQWDVVNEAIEPRDGGADLMRRTPFYKMLGADYVSEAFRLAAEAAPTARLYLNDYDVTYDESWQQKRRTGVLRLLDTLITAGVPIHGFGLQSHLNTKYAFNAKVYRQFITELEAMGLEIAITELDVREADAAGNRSLAARSQRAADEVDRILSVALDSPALTGVVTWGLSDSHSWLRSARQLPDNQGLPYDDTYSPTPMRTTLAKLFANARIRHD